MGADYLLIQGHELDQKIAEVYKHIQTERKILEATHNLRQATSNQDVLRRNEIQIRESERSLSYFENTLRELQARKQQQLQQESSSGSPVPPVCGAVCYPICMNTPKSVSVGTTEGI